MEICRSSRSGDSAVTAIISTYNFLKSGQESTGEVETRAVGFAPIDGGRGAGFFARGSF